VTVFSDVAPCSLIEVYRRFTGAYCLMMNGVNTYSTSVSFYQTTRCNVREDSHLHACHHENLISHICKVNCHRAAVTDWELDNLNSIPGRGTDFSFHLHIQSTLRPRHIFLQWVPGAVEPLSFSPKPVTFLSYLNSQIRIKSVFVIISISDVMW
jgi:hypothetical protein